MQPQQLGSAGARPLAVGCLTPRNTPLFTCYRAEFGHSGLNGTSVIKEIRLKILTPRVPPFNVTQGHWNRHGAISDL